MEERGGEWYAVGAHQEGGAGLGQLTRALREGRAGLFAAAAVAAIALVGGGLLAASAASPHLDFGGAAETIEGGSADPGLLVVDVGGAVRMPGVYRLPAGARVGDAIRAAGGFGPGVDAAAVVAAINLAAPLTDGQKIVVPGRAPAGVSASTPPAGSRASSGGLVDINHASEAELEALPGIGPATAAKIIAARTERPFATAQELLDRRIVGKATWEKIRALVTAG